MSAGPTNDTMNVVNILRRLVLAVVLLLGAAVLGLSPVCSAAAPVEPGIPAEIGQFYQEGHYDQAIEALEAAIGKAPADATLHYWLGRSYYELSDYGKSISSLDRAVTLDSSNAEYHLWLGLACGRKAEESNMFTAFGLARRTHHEFQVAVQLDKTNLEAQRDLIRFMLNAPGFLGGGDDHALQQMAALALVDPVQADLARAEYFASRKKFDQAAEQYGRLLRSDRHKPGVYFEIAEYYRDRDDPEDMKKCLDIVSKVSPADQRMDYYLGVQLVLANSDPGAAEKYLRMYLADVPANSAFPSQSSAHEWLGKLYEAQNRPDQAADEYRTALSLNSRNKDAREGLKRVEK